jgi:hypothetical protein
MNHIKLIEKGAKVFVMEVEDFSGQRLPDFELVVGEDILESNIETLIVSYDEVEDAVVDYIRNVYPEIHDYMIDIESY